MARLPIDDVLYAKPPASPIVEAALAILHQKVRRKFTEHLAGGGQGFDDFVFGSSDCGLTRADVEGVEAALLDAGHRFDWSAAISVAERPDVYKGGAESGDFMFEHSEAVTANAGADGRAQVSRRDFQSIEN